MSAEQKINWFIKHYKKFFKEHYVCLGKGRNRIVYRITENYVVKVPLNWDGIEDNYHESSLAKKENQQGYFANCVMLGDMLLLMEYVEPTHKSYSELPSWVGCIDCAQVGYTKDGRLVAYDFGYF
jgi:hypothetical protein